MRVPPLENVLRTACFTVLALVPLVVGWYGFLMHVEYEHWRKVRAPSLICAEAHSLAQVLDDLKAAGGPYPRDLTEFRSVHRLVGERIESIQHKAKRWCGVELSEVVYTVPPKGPAGYLLQLRGTKGAVRVCAGGVVEVTANLAPPAEQRSPWLVVVN